MLADYSFSLLTNQSYPFNTCGEVCNEHHTSSQTGNHRPVRRDQRIDVLYIHIHNSFIKVLELRITNKLAFKQGSLLTANHHDRIKAY